MSKRRFIVTQTLPSGLERIVGIASVADDVGCSQRIFTLEERYIFVQAFSDICSDKDLDIAAKKRRVDALFSEFA